MNYNPNSSNNNNNNTAYKHINDEQLKKMIEQYVNYQTMLETAKNQAIKTLSNQIKEIEPLIVDRMLTAGIYYILINDYQELTAIPKRRKTPKKLRLLKCVQEWSQRHAVTLNQSNPNVTQHMIEQQSAQIAASIWREVILKADKDEFEEDMDTNIQNAGETDRKKGKVLTDELGNAKYSLKVKLTAKGMEKRAQEEEAKSGQKTANNTAVLF